MFVAAAFWLAVVPLIVASLVVGATYRGFFGLPVMIWRGIEEPGEVAELVLKAAVTGDAAPEDNDEDVLSGRAR
jgi:hypothetical protein